MRLLRDSEILSLCDQGRGQHAWIRGLLPVAVASGRTPEELLDWPLGQRNQQLLLLRKALVGPELDAVSTCPDLRCRQSVEVSFPISSLTSLQPPPSNLEFSVTCADRSLLLRPVRCRDLVPDARGELTPLNVLLRCVRDTDDCDSTLPPLNDVLNDPGISKLLQHQLEQLDPLARIQFTMLCPGCNSKWLESLNIADFFWQELQQIASGIFADVHVLASAYGWSEQYILSLSSQRRNSYRQLISQSVAPSRLRIGRFA
jgi:hypothetical protein